MPIEWHQHERLELAPTDSSLTQLQYTLLRKDKEEGNRNKRVNFHSRNVEV